MDLKQRLFAALLLLCSHPLSAAPLETLTVTASRSEQPITQLPNSLSVVPREELELVRHVHISELLVSVPGVWISRGNGQEHLTAIRSPVLTGAGSCGAFYIAEDGVQTRGTGFCNVNELFDINTEQAGSIEVLRGPGNEFHGSNALHGVINVRSLAPSAEQENTLSLEGGPHRYGRLLFSNSNTVDAQAYRISINAAHDGGYKDSAGFDQQKLTFRHDYSGTDITVSTLLNVSNLDQDTAGYLYGKKAYKDSDRKKENPDPDAYRDSQSARLQSHILLALNHRSSLIITPYVRRTEMDFLMHFLPGTPVEKNGQNGLGVQSNYQYRFSDQLLLSSGIDGEYTDGWLKQTQRDSVTFSDAFPQGKQYDYQVYAGLLAAFSRVEYALGDNSRINAGARYEYLHYDYNNQMISGNSADDGTPCPGGCRYSRPDDRHDDFGDWSFNLGLVQELTPFLTLTGNMSHGFRAPQATELYRLQAGQQLAQLDSEQLDSIDVGLRGATQTLSYGLVGFYMEKDHVIFQSSDRLNLDNGKTRHYGIEYDLGWQISEQWQVYLRGTHAHHEYRKNVSALGAEFDISGNDIDTAPHNMGSAQLSWTPLPATTVELQWVYMGKYFTDIDNQQRYQGHQLWNLRLRQTLTPSISAGLRVTNLGDIDYAERADYSSRNGDRYFVGEPRSLYADISFSF